jgi:hypothetical protein
MAQSSTINYQLSANRQFVWRIIDVIIGGIFIYAGAIKVLDPVQFATDIDNYKILPWMISVGLAFYLPWLEILCGLPRRHNCRKSPRLGHHLRLFRSCQPKLELPHPSRGRSRNSRRIARACLSSGVWK